MARIRLNNFAVVGNDGSGISGMSFNPYRKSYSGIEDYVAHAKKFYGGNSRPRSRPRSAPATNWPTS